MSPGKGPEGWFRPSIVEKSIYKEDKIEFSGLPNPGIMVACPVFEFFWLPFV